MPRRRLLSPLLPLGGVSFRISAAHSTPRNRSWNCKPVSFRLCQASDLLCPCTSLLLGGTFREALLEALQNGGEQTQLGAGLRSGGGKEVPLQCRVAYWKGSLFQEMAEQTERSWLEGHQACWGLSYRVVVPGRQLWR